MELEILKALILKSGLSKRDFCEKVGKPQSRLSERLNGKRNIKLSELNKMAEKLGLEIRFKVI